MKIALALLAAVTLAGCQTLSPTAFSPVAVDTFCLTAKKRGWSINDSPESIRDAEIWNGTIDRRCGRAKA